MYTGLTDLKKNRSKKKKRIKILQIYTVYGTYRAPQQTSRIRISGSELVSYPSAV